MNASVPRGGNLLAKSGNGGKNLLQRFFPELSAYFQQSGWVKAAVLWTAFMTTMYLLGVLSGKPFFEKFAWDYHVYRDAAVKFLSHQSMYVYANGEAWWWYLPPGVILFIPLALVPESVGIVVMLLGLVFSYLDGIELLLRILKRVMPSYKVAAWLVAIMIAFTDAIGTAGFLNVAPFLFFLTVLAIWAALEHPTWKGALIIAFVAMFYFLTKWYWGFFLVPLVIFTRKPQFMILSVVFFVLFVVGLLGIFVAISGPEYTVTSFREYFTMATKSADDFDWTGPGKLLNNSVLQLSYRYGGLNNPLAPILRWFVPIFFSLYMLRYSLKAWNAGVTLYNGFGVVMMVCFGWYMNGMTYLIYIPDVILGPLPLSVMWEHKQPNVPFWKRVRVWIFPFTLIALHQFASLVSVATHGAVPTVSEALPTVAFSILTLFIALRFYINDKLKSRAAATSTLADTAPIAVMAR